MLQIQRGRHIILGTELPHWRILALRTRREHNLNKVVIVMIS